MDNKTYFYVISSNLSRYIDSFRSKNVPFFVGAYPTVILKDEKVAEVLRGLSIPKSRYVVIYESEKNLENFARIAPFDSYSKK